MDRLNLIAGGILLSLALGCPGGSDTKHDPVVGTMVDYGGYPIPNVKVSSSVNSALQAGSSESDSTAMDGSYYIAQGIAIRYSESSGCGSEPKYDGMADFYITAVHPSYDTTIAAFVVDREHTRIPDILLMADTIFVGDRTGFNPVGSLIHLPAIVMNNRTR